MFCNQCGQENVEGSNFCQSCGKDTSENLKKITTLRELNNKCWYRFLKVLYVLCYLPCLGILIFFFSDNLKTYHERFLPKTIQEVLKDPDFYKLDKNDKYDVLSSIDEGSYKKSYAEELMGIEHTLKPDEVKLIIEKLKSQPIPTTPLKNKYVYLPYYSWNITEILLSLLLTFGYLLITEFIRRSFYYVMIGKVFPKE